MLIARMCIPVGEVGRVGLSASTLVKDLRGGMSSLSLVRSRLVVVRTLHHLGSVDCQEGSQRHGGEQDEVAETRSSEHVDNAASSCNAVSAGGP